MRVESSWHNLEAFYLWIFAFSELAEMLKEAKLCDVLLELNVLGAEAQGVWQRINISRNANRVNVPVRLGLI